MDVLQLAHEMPPSIGLTDHSAGRIRLRVKGLTYCDAASLLHDFVLVVRLAWERYQGAQEPPCVSRDDVARLMNEADEVHLVSLSRIALAEGILWGSGSGDPAGAWELEVHDSIRHFRDITDPISYVGVLETLQPPSSAIAGAPSLVVGQVTGAAAELHPRIQAVTAGALADGHYKHAVREAVLALRDLVREHSGLGLDGDQLMGAAFGGAAPKISVGELDTASGRDLQQGVRLLAQGVIAAFRNPLAHESGEIDARAALDAIGLVSWLAARIDPAAAMSPWPGESRVQ